MVALVEGTRGRRREQRVRERCEGPRGVSVASLEGPGRKQEVAGAASAPATHLFVLLAEEEDDKGEEVGWAGQIGWPAGPGKWRQVTSFSLCFIYFCSVLFFLFSCH